MKDALRALRTRWWLLPVCLLLGLAVSGLVLWRATPVYSSSNQLFVGWNGPNQIGGAGPTVVADEYAADLFAQQRLASYVRVLESEDTAASVITDLGLATTPAELASRVHATSVTGTVILTVTVTDTSSQAAQAIAADYGRSFARSTASLETAPGAVRPPVVIATLQPALLDSDPVSPDVARDLGLGAAGGLLAGLLLALLPDATRRSVTSSEDVRDSTGHEVMTTLVEEDRSDLPSSRDAGPNASAMRAIRAGLHLGLDQPLRVIAVAGAEPGVGASTLAVDLARSLTQAGSRVALLDLDLHAPTVVGALGMTAEVGLADVLSGSARIDEATRPCADGTLTVLAGGIGPLETSSLVTSSRLRELLSELRQSHDVVVVDSPPLFPVPDAAGLGDAVDGFLLVSRFGHTHQERLSDAAAALDRGGAVLHGVVLGRTPPQVARRRGLRVEYAPDRLRETRVSSYQNLGSRAVARTVAARSAVGRAADPELS